MGTAQRTALVTGAFGFTGGHLARRLLAEGWSVRGFGTVKSKQRAAAVPEIEPIFGDLATGEGLDDAPKGAMTVFHVASIVATSDRELAQRVIVDGTRKLAEAAIRHGVMRFIHVGSTSVYGHGEVVNVDEDHPLKPEDPYGEGKADAERLLLEMDARGDLEVVILRPRLIYGPGDQHFIPTVCENLRAKRVILINGGRAVNDFVWVEDLVEAMMLAAQTPRARGRVYNITSGESVPSREFFESVAAQFALPKPSVSLPYPLAWIVAALMTAAQRIQGQQSTSYSPLKRLKLFGNSHHFSIERARSELGYSPRVTLKDGLARMGNQG